MRLSGIERLILRDLFTASKLDAYTFYRRYKLAPVQLFSAVNSLAREKLLTVEGNAICITSNGREYVSLTDTSILEGETRPWRTVPESCKGASIDPWQPYIPSTKRLDKCFWGR